MRESELVTENHRNHALEWRSDDTCVLCLMEIIRGDSSSRLKIHRRFALATFNQRLDPDVTRSSFQQDNGSSKNLAKLLQKNCNVSSQVLSTLLGTLTSVDVVDLAIEAVYRLYHRVLRDETVLDNVLTHCVQKIGEDLDQPEKWVPYLSVMQRLARLNSSAVALAISQNAKLENEMVEHLSDHLSEFVALHVVALLDPIVRSDGEGILIRASRRPILMLQLARLLQNSQCQQLVCAVLGFALMLWIKEDLQQQEQQQHRQHDNSGGLKIQQLLATTANGLKRIILQSQPEIQVAALQVLDAVLLKCRQLTDGLQMMTVLMDQQDLAELMYDVLYSSHLPLLEFALRCLHHLSRCPPFFQHRCVILGVEPLLRVIPHLADSNASALSGGLIVAYAVHLLSDMLSKYDGEESLLQRCVSTDHSNGGFHTACRIASMALNSCALHLEMGGACLVAALLLKKNLPVPIPLDRVADLIRSCVKSLAPPEKKWKSETGRIHLQGLTRLLSSATALIVYLTDDPRARLSSYASANSAQLASYQESLDKLIDLIVATIDELITAFQQVDKESLWSDFFLVLVQLASGSAAGANYVQASLRGGFLLSRVYAVRGSPCLVESERDSTDDLLTWFLARSLDGNQASSSTSRIMYHHQSSLRVLVRSIPSSVAEWADWLSRDKRSPFGAKCAALVLLYQLELCETSKETRFVGEHSEAILSAIADLMLTRSPCDMDDADLLRSVWFLIARYSDGFHEASKAFVHLVKWFQPNGSLLLPWLRRIYTPHLSLMRWAFALKDIALYLGSYMILLWIDDEDDGDDLERKRTDTLVNLCLERSDDDVLLLSIFDLAFHEDANVSCCVASVLERVADKNEAMRVAIGRMIKYNIPRFLRLTDVTDDNYSRLIGSLRLLCRLSSSSRQRSGPVADAVISDDSISAWRDPAIVAALVSFLSRTVRFGQHQVKLGAMDLWSWSCRYLETVLLSVTETTCSPSPSSRVLYQIVMENRNFIEFVDEIYRRDELPVWRYVAQLVAAMAAFHHHHSSLKVVSPLRVSMARLSRKLTAGLVGVEGDAAESLDVILQLLEWLLRDPPVVDSSSLTETSSTTTTTPTANNSSRRLVIDPSLEDDGRCRREGEEEDPANRGRDQHRYCIQERNCLLEHLWYTLVNWTMRSADGSSTKNRIYACLSQLMLSCRRSLPPAQFALLASQPWNYKAVVDSVRSPTSSSVEAIQLATALIRHTKPTLKSCGVHPWSARLEETLSRHPSSQSNCETL